MCLILRKANKSLFITYRYSNFLFYSYTMHFPCFMLCLLVLWADRACAAGQTQLLSSGSDNMLQPGTRDLAPAGLARLCGGLHLYHSFDRRESHTHACTSCTHTNTTLRRYKGLKIWPVVDPKRCLKTVSFPLISGLWFDLWQNFCSEAVCYSEMITRKIDRNQLGRDHKSFTVQVMPVARQTWERAHNDVESKCQQEFSLVLQRAQLEISPLTCLH